MRALKIVNRQEIDTLGKQFSILAPQTDKIDRSRFRDLLADTFGVDDSLLMDRGMCELDCPFQC